MFYLAYTLFHIFNELNISIVNVTDIMTQTTGLLAPIDLITTDSES